MGHDERQLSDMVANPLQCRHSRPARENIRGEINIEAFEQYRSDIAGIFPAYQP
jgi:hypothetical protein